MNCNDFMKNIYDFLESEIKDCDLNCLMEQHINECEKCRLIYETKAASRDELILQYSTPEVRLDSRRTEIMEKLKPSYYGNSIYSKLKFHFRRYKLNYGVSLAAALMIIFMLPSTLSDKQFISIADRKVKSADNNPSLSTAYTMKDSSEIATQFTSLDIAANKSSKDVTNQNASASGKQQASVLKVYLVKNLTPSQFQKASLSLEELQLEDEPLFTDNDIVSYNWTNHVIQFKEGVADKKLKLNIGVSGKVFLLEINDKRVYAGSLWTPISSLIVPAGPVIMLEPVNNNSIRIDYSGDSDLRNMAEIADALKGTNKLIYIEADKVEIQKLKNEKVEKTIVTEKTEDINTILEAVNARDIRTGVTDFGKAFDYRIKIYYKDSSIHAYSIVKGSQICCSNDEGNDFSYRIGGSRAADLWSLLENLFKK